MPKITRILFQVKYDGEFFRGQKFFLFPLCKQNFCLLSTSPVFCSKLICGQTLNSGASLEFDSEDSEASIAPF